MPPPSSRDDTGIATTTNRDSRGNGDHITLTSPRHRHPENCSDSLTLGDFARRPTGSFKPLHKICDFDLMFDAHIRDGHLHKPNRSSQCRQALRDGLE